MSRRPLARDIRRGALGGGFFPPTAIAGCVAFWDASRGLVLSGSNVTTAADQAPGGVADTLTGQAGLEPQFVASDGGWPCFDFQNTRLFNCPDSTDLSATAGFTVAAWVKRSSTTSDDAIWTQYDITKQRILWRIDATTNNFYVEINNIGTATGAYGASLGWSHLACVFDGSLAAASRVQLYVNGVAVTTTCSSVPAALADTTSVLFVGADSAAGARAFDGKMDSVCAFSRALTLAEVNALKGYHPHA